VLSTLIGLSVAIECIYLAIRGIWTGRIKPFRFGSQFGLKEIQKEMAPAEFWFWYVTYLVLGLAALLMAILRISEKLKPR